MLDPGQTAEAAPEAFSTDHGQDPGPDLPAIELLTITQAAQVLGVTRETIRLRVRRGKLHATKIDGQWYVRLDRPGSDDDRSESTTLGHNDLRPAVNQNQTRGLTEVSQTELVTARAEICRLEETVSILQIQADRWHSMLTAEQEAHRREVSELHILLQRAQAQIPMPNLAAQPDQPVEDKPAPAPKRRSWWSRLFSSA